MVHGIPEPHMTTRMQQNSAVESSLVKILRTVGMRESAEIKTVINLLWLGRVGLTAFLHTMQVAKLLANLVSAP